MEIQDILITPIYFLIIWFVARLIRAGMPEGSPGRRYFVPGLMLKLWGALGVGIIYKFYYGFGDTLNYFKAGAAYSEVFWRSPFRYLQGLFVDFDSFQILFPELTGDGGEWYLSVESALPIAKICSVLGMFCFQSYFATALLFAVISYSGIWALYKVFLRLYPHLSRELAIACLFVPSVFFWGSGIVKDSITLAAVGWLVYAFYHIFFAKKKIGFSIIMILFWGSLLTTIKLYIMAALLPTLLLWVVLKIPRQIQNPLRKFIFGPFLIIVAAIVLLVSADAINRKIQAAAIDNVLEHALVSAKWNATGYQKASASAYQIDFDKIDVNSPSSFLKLMPELVFLTLYRPFIWEANKAVILLSALENFIFLIFTLRLFIRRNPFRVIRTIFSDPNILFFLAFTIGFSFAMGLSSGVFGALVRYKIPMLPFFVASLFILYDRTRRADAPR